MIKATFNYPKNSAELISIIGKTEFKPFDKLDWDSFSGCESANPLIGYYEKFTIILDGDSIGFFHEYDFNEGAQYEFKRII